MYNDKWDVVLREGGNEKGPGKHLRPLSVEEGRTIKMTI